MPYDITAESTFQTWLEDFAAALSRRDIDAVIALFDAEECFWRDMVSFTWNISTMDGPEAIRAMLESQLEAALPVSFTAEEASLTDGVLEGWFRFETATTRGRGIARLREGRCWTLLTAIDELKGHEERARRTRVEGIDHRAVKARRTWLDEREETTRTLGHSAQPYCLIVGGSQGGLALAARMKRLGVPTLVIDALPKPGDAWRNRYKTLYLHDPIWVDHLPYLPFPDHWPVYTSKDKMADWLEAYAKVMEIDFWGSTRCLGASYDDVAGRWTVRVEREGQVLELHPSQFVLATGLSGMPKTPRFPGMDEFAGLQCHSSEYTNGSQFAGKRCVVVGANNSAHDIAVDLWANDADVTMIQRSPTTVIRIGSMRKLAERGPYSEGAMARGVTMDKADLIVASTPFRVRERLDRTNCEAIQADDAEFYARLAARGFRFDFGDDNTAIGGKYMRTASGYYIDVGGSDLIAEGEIKVRSEVGVERIGAGEVVLSDGTSLPADAIFYATGYGPMESWAEMLISPEVAEKIGPCWGLGSGTRGDPGPWEGELRNLWKPTAQQGLWFHGGNLLQSRYHSLHLALQIKARMEGIGTLVFRPAPFERSLGAA